MSIISELKEKYQNRLSKMEAPRKPNDFNPSLYLFQKWAYKVPKGWYGFDLDGAPFIWGQIIDDFLEYVQKYCPDFEIQQIKVKFGGLRMYLNFPTNYARAANMLNCEISDLENWLSDERLVY